MFKLHYSSLLPIKNTSRQTLCKTPPRPCQALPLLGNSFSTTSVVSHHSDVLFEPYFIPSRASIATGTHRRASPNKSSQRNAPSTFKSPLSLGEQQVRRQQKTIIPIPVEENNAIAALKSISLRIIGPQSLFVWRKSWSNDTYGVVTRSLQLYPPKTSITQHQL